VPIFLGVLVLGAAAHAAEPAWDFSASAYNYFVPDDPDYLQPTVTADRGALHLEARYNYEDLETGSVWAGYNLAGGGEIAFEFTPMLGGVFGATDGIAPGYHASLDWRRLGLYSESEYRIDTADRGDSFFYTWSELTLSPSDRFRGGLVVQRTRAYENSRDIQRGPLVGFSVERVEFTGYVFNPDDLRPLCVVAVSAKF